MIQKTSGPYTIAPECASTVTIVMGQSRISEHLNTQALPRIFLKHSTLRRCTRAPEIKMTRYEFLMRCRRRIDRPRKSSNCALRLPEVMDRVRKSAPRWKKCSDAIRRTHLY